MDKVLNNSYPLNQYPAMDDEFTGSIGPTGLMPGDLFKTRFTDFIRTITIRTGSHLFMGIATSSTNPTTGIEKDTNLCYIAAETGSTPVQYTNFKIPGSTGTSITLETEIALLKSVWWDDGTGIKYLRWTKEPLCDINKNEPTSGEVTFNNLKTLMQHVADNLIGVIKGYLGNPMTGLAGIRYSSGQWYWSFPNPFDPWVLIGVTVPVGTKVFNTGDDSNIFGVEQYKTYILKENNNVELDEKEEFDTGILEKMMEYNIGVWTAEKMDPANTKDLHSWINNNGPKTAQYCFRLGDDTTVKSFSIEEGRKIFLLEDNTTYKYTNYIFVPE